MNLDDESLLSAFLDDELDPADRRTVEAVLSADERLAERLRTLREVKSELSSLPRPPLPVDLPPLVLDRIRRSSRFRLPELRPRPRWVAASLAAAAVLLVMVVWNRRGPLDDLPLQQETAGADPVAKAVDRALTDAEDALAGRDENAPDVGPLVAETNPDPGAGREASDPPADPIRDLLDQPDLRRLTVLLDDYSDQQIRNVKEAIQETARENSMLGEIHIAQGIEIDPDRPGEAVVFITVLEHDEFLALQKNIARRARSLAVEDTDVPAAVVTQLVDLGPIQMTPAPPRGSPLGRQPPDLGPTHFALRVDRGAEGGNSQPEPGPEPDPLVPESALPALPPGREEPRVAGDSRRAEPAILAEESPTPETSLETPSVVLVWVSLRGPGGPSF